MRSNGTVFRIGAALGLLLALAAGAGEAQAQANNRGRQQLRPPVERDDDRHDRSRRERDERGADRYRSRRGNGSGKVPPGWCRGVGNPHNTRENCGYDSRAVERSRARDRGERYGDRGGRYDRYSYEEAHDRFHRELDARYSRLAADRPVDLRYQLELRARKQAEHDEWHRRMGARH